MASGLLRGESNARSAPGLAAAAGLLLKPGIQGHPSDTEGLGDDTLGNPGLLELCGQSGGSLPFGLQPGLNGLQTQTLFEEGVHLVGGPPPA